MRSNRIFETIRNGNCTFNAFALPLSLHLDYIQTVFFGSQVKLSSKDIQACKLFLKQVGKALNLHPIKFSTIKSKLLSLNAQEKYADIQKALAPALRQLAVSQLKNNEEAQAATLQSLLNTFEHYQTPEAAQDDIYLQHSFIDNKFQALLNKAHLMKLCEDNAAFLEVLKKSNCNQNEIKTIAQSFLEAWWKEEGYDQFLEQMKRDTFYAGDLELAALAKFFKLNLKITSPHYSYEAYTENRSAPEVNVVHKNRHYDVEMPIAESKKVRSSTQKTHFATSSGKQLTEASHSQKSILGSLAQFIDELISRKNTFNANLQAWQKMKEKAQAKVINKPHADKLTYFFSLPEVAPKKPVETIIEVTPNDQIKLDEQLAKYYQDQEIKAFEQTQAQIKADEEYAHELSRANNIKLGK